MLVSVFEMFAKPPTINPNFQQFHKESDKKIDGEGKISRRTIAMRTSKKTEKQTDEKRSTSFG